MGSHGTLESLSTSQSTSCKDLLYLNLTKWHACEIRLAQLFLRLKRFYNPQLWYSKAWKCIRTWIYLNLKILYSLDLSERWNILCSKAVITLQFSLGIHSVTLVPVMESSYARPFPLVLTVLLYSVWKFELCGILWTWPSNFRHHTVQIQNLRTRAKSAKTDTASICHTTVRYRDLIPLAKKKSFV
jgi:hypothetical protein